MLPCWGRLRGWRLSLLSGFFLSISFASVFVAVLVYAVNSDLDNLHPSIVRLLPAGHSLCKSAPVFESETCLDIVTKQLEEPQSQSLRNWRYQYGRDDKNEGLDEAQCISAFPGLFEDVHRATKFRKDKPITSEEVENMTIFPGMAKAMIFNGELYIITVNCMGDDHRKKIIGILSSIHRSISSMPNPRDIPDIIFAFTVEDMADDPNVPLWTLARRAEDENLWLMPDFGLWSWDLVGLGPYDEVVNDLLINETTSPIPWVDKTPQVVWRGKLSFAPKIRHALLDTTRDKDWSDVAPVQWTPHLPAGTGTNVLTPIEQCTYQFIAHTEGRSYSASLKYRQACNSVVISHKLQWLQHHHYLLSSSGPHQNFVEVERDFSDLEEKVQELLENNEKAELIAGNSVRTFRERYLTRAAGACYWRQLINGWAKVSEGMEVELFVDDGMDGKKKRGMRFENFVLLQNGKQLSFP